MNLILGCAMWVSKQKMKKNISNYSMMNHKVSYIYTLVLFILTCLMCSQAVLAAPPTIEIYSGSGSGLGPTAGPVVTTFKLNANNPSDNNYVDYAPLTTATYTITNSAFNLASYQGSTDTNRPNLTIGGTGTTATVQASNVIAPLVSIGSGQDNMFASSLQNAPTGCTNGSGCYSTNGGIRAGSSSSDTTANYGVAMFIKTTGFAELNVSTTNRVYVGRVQVNFNRPVTNPILQAAGMGGAVVGGLGYSAEFTLVSSNLGSLPVLSRLAGSKELSVIGNDITNNASIKSATSDQGGASGSIYIKGKGITTLVFDMYIRGDGRGTWSNFGGDVFFFGISSMDVDSAIALVKSQRVGNTGTFVSTGTVLNFV
ncbi:hypothetical protein APD01_10920 [Acinetobacter soli]|nr:hypothetical protein APD01_10920 [Acinetobacter soli]